jgi:hypothetical protein
MTGIADGSVCGAGGICCLKLRDFGAAMIEKKSDHATG